MIENSADKAWGSCRGSDAIGLPPIPGPCLVADEGASRGAAPGRSDVRGPSWLQAEPEWGCCSVAKAGTVTMMLSGYLLGHGGRAVHGEAAAALALGRYLRRPERFPEGLRGSFSGAVVEHEERRVLLFTDWLASRPVFYHVGRGGRLVAAPQVSWIVGRLRDPPEVDEASVCAFVIFGAQLGPHTLFRGIRKLPPGGVVEWGAGRARERRHWRFAFEPDGSRTHAALLDEADDVIRESVRIAFRCMPDPFLFLSGGVDSRVILGAALAEGISPSCVTFGTSQGDEADVAARVARAAGVPLKRVILPALPTAGTVVEAALLGDCHAEAVDFPNVGGMYRNLAREFGAFVNGDEAFGWRERAGSPDDARRLVGIFTLGEVARLASWIPPSRQRELDEELEARIASAWPDDGTPPDQIKDCLYYEHRLGNMLNAFSYARLRFLEQARPLVSEPVMDFVRTLPDEWRERKRILRALLRERYPDLAAVPLARGSAIPPPAAWAEAVAHDPEGLGALVRRHLLEGPPGALDALFGSEAFSRFVRAVLAGAPWPPLPGPWWASLPGLWRLHARRAVNRVHPVSLLMRVLQVAIYLDWVAREGAAARSARAG